MTIFAKTRLLAFITPLALLAGALGSQYVGGLFPCEMCHWQRWPHYAALALATLAFLPLDRSPQRMLVLLAAVAITISGAIGVFHAGVEYHWWKGLTQCSTTSAATSTADILAEIMATPLIQCDQAQWTLFGISLAGFNALFSLSSAMLIFGLWLKPNQN